VQKDNPKRRNRIEQLEGKTTENGRTIEDGQSIKPKGATAPTNWRTRAA